MKIMRNILNFQFCLPEYFSGQKIYGCIMYHPLMDACFTPTSYPVDEIYMIYNGLIEERFSYKQEEIMNGKQDIVTISFTTKNNIAENESDIIFFVVKWNSKITYHLPICDCMESWEFVFSKEPINQKLYLEGYIQKSENVFVCKSDLEEKLRRERRIF